MRWTINNDTTNPPKAGDRVTWQWARATHRGTVIQRLHDVYLIADDDGSRRRVLHEKTHRLTVPGKSV